MVVVFDIEKLIFSIKYILHLETKMFILHLLDHFDSMYLIPEELY